MITVDDVLHLSNLDLLAELKAVARREREATARLVALLAHVGARRLYLAEGCSRSWERGTESRKAS